MVITDLNGKALTDLVLVVIELLNPDTFLTKGLEFTSKLDFDRTWGLGSSSTLLTNLAQWADINPYSLLNNTFTGSGYDIACASAENAIFYTINNETPIIEQAAFNPSFKDDLKKTIYRLIRSILSGNDFVLLQA